MKPSGKDFMKLSTFLLTVLSLLGIINQTEGVVDYCDEHTFQTNTSYLQFTKEISSKDYALANKFKSLHCCAKGYRSIEWYKDGIAYPWPSGVSNLILYPESANQTVYAQTVSTIDSGNYTCVVRNDSHVIIHSVLLLVLESEVDDVGYTGSPLPTYEPKDRYARRGESARFFCEAFVGRVDLPDAKSEVRWWRSIPYEGEVSADGYSGLEDNNGLQKNSGLDYPELGMFPVVGDVSLHHQHHHSHKKHHVKPKPRFHQEVVPREDNQILGAYLLIREIQSEDFGEYRCSVRNTAGEHSLLMSSWLKEEEAIEDKPKIVVEEVISQKHPVKMYFYPFLVGGIIMVVLCCTALIFYMSRKGRWAKDKPADGKEYDVCVFYENKEKPASLGKASETAKNVSLSHIISTFESHQGYHCFTHPLPPFNDSPLTVPQEVHSAIERSRRLLLVINPSRQSYEKIPPTNKLDVSGDCFESIFYNSVNELLKLHPNSVCLILTEKNQGRNRGLKGKLNDIICKLVKNEIKGKDVSAEEMFIPDMKSKFEENAQVILWSGIPTINSPDWKNLLSAMPQKKTGNSSNLKTVPIRRSNSHNTLSNSHESLQVLV